MKTLKWRPPRPDGTRGEEVAVLMPDADHAYLVALWKKVERAPEGRERERMLNELRTHLDLRSLLPGGQFVE